MSEQITTAEELDALSRAVSTLYDGEDGSREKDYAYALLDAHLATLARPDAPVTAGGSVTRGADLIAAERRRQVEAEGWTPEHDAEHASDDLATAAACYALPEWRRSHYSLPWPWDMQWWKPTPDDRVRELVKAGALIAAEIDRLRAVVRSGEQGGEGL